MTDNEPGAVVVDKKATSATERPEKTHPFSVRFTESEKTRLLGLAGDVPVGTYIRCTVLGEAAALRQPRRQPVRDADQLGRLLGALGQSHLANNLNQLAKAANLGTLLVTPELEADLKRACAEISEMRGMLLSALGIRKGDSRKLADEFAKRAGVPK